jgi:hypothetical protein
LVLRRRWRSVRDGGKSGLIARRVKMIDWRIGQHIGATGFYVLAQHIDNLCL